jgi:hypothetical protein
MKIASFFEKNAKNHIFDGHFFQESLKSVKIDCIRIPHGILRGKVV